MHHSASAPGTELNGVRALPSLSRFEPVRWQAPRDKAAQRKPLEPQHSWRDKSYRLNASRRAKLALSLGLAAFSKRDGDMPPTIFTLLERNGAALTISPEDPVAIAG